MRPRLKPLNGGPEIQLNPGILLVGRSKSCEIPIQHKSVSNLHCVLVVNKDLILVRDMNSSNGTRVNGRRVLRAVIRPGDEVGIAMLRYRSVLIEDQREINREELLSDPDIDVGNWHYPASAGGSGRMMADEGSEIDSDAEV